MSQHASTDAIIELPESIIATVAKIGITVAATADRDAYVRAVRAGVGETTTSAEACVDAASTPAGAVCACAMAAMAVRPSPRRSRETPREGRWVAAGWPVGRSSSVVTRAEGLTSQRR